jgi:transcription antitermination factor NusG
MPEGEFWGAAQVISNHERRAAQNVEDQGWRVLYPFFMDHPLHGGPVPRPLWPGYILILLDDRPWGAINNTPGVVRLLASSRASPYRLDPKSVASLQRCLRPHPDGRSSECLLDVGTEVRILRGPFSEHNAVVEWSERQRLGLLFTIFGRENKVEFDVADVEVV